MSEISHDQGFSAGGRPAVGARTVADHSEVRFAAAITGQANLTVSVPCRTTRGLYAYLGDRIGALAGVQPVDTALVLRRGKVITEEIDRPENAKYIPLITLCA
jgi:hypothetical protein